MERLNYSFKKGCGKVLKEDYSRLQHELMVFLECKTRQHFYTKRLLYPNMPAHIKSGIEDLFGKYGVEPSEIWTITPVVKKSVKRTEA